MKNKKSTKAPLGICPECFDAHLDFGDFAYSYCSHHKTGAIWGSPIEKNMWVMFTPISRKSFDLKFYALLEGVKKA